MRRRQRGPPGPGRNPPKSSLLSTSSPRACQNVIARNAKMLGIKTFPRLITRKLTAATSRVPNKAIFRTLKKRYLFISCSSILYKLVIDGLQSTPQPHHGVSLPRQQRIDADAGGFAHFLKAPALYFMRYKHLALLLGQVFEC